MDGVPRHGGDGGAASGDAGSTSSVDGGGTSGLPCDVAAVLEADCLSCHGATPAGGATFSLTSYEALTGPSNTDSSRSMLEVAIERMSSTTRPMPPTGGASTSDIQTMQAWLDAGSPRGDCTATDPFGTPDTCTSGVTYTPVFDGEGEEEGDELMRPGEACITCHTANEGPRFALAGTVYPTAHEYDRCNGLGPSGGTVTIEVTDSTGRVEPMIANPVGNFTSSARGLTPPYTAVVRYQGRERAMTTPVPSGDCNSCHTLRGASGAPGRVLAP